MAQSELAKSITEAAVIEFDKLKGTLNLTYDKDFQAFATGYAIGCFATCKTLMDKPDILLDNNKIDGGI
jgi:hypothetical protein